MRARHCAYVDTGDGDHTIPGGGGALLAGGASALDGGGGNDLFALGGGPDLPLLDMLVDNTRLQAGDQTS